MHIKRDHQGARVCTTRSRARFRVRVSMCRCLDIYHRVRDCNTSTMYHIRIMSITSIKTSYMCTICILLAINDFSNFIQCAAYYDAADGITKSSL